MAYNTTVLAETSLVHYWELTEASGASTLADSKGSAAITVPATGATTGVTGSPSLPDGNAVQLAAQVLTATGGGYGASQTQVNMAMEAWVDITSVPSNARGEILYNQPNGAGLCISRDGQTSQHLFVIYDAVAWQDTSYTLSLNVTHHLVLNILSNGAPEVWVDGSKVFTGSSAPNFNAGSDALIFQNSFNGKVNNVAFYNATLSQTQIQQHYNDGIATLPAGSTRVTQLAAETLVTPTPSTRVTQLAAETLVVPTASTRMTQLAAETLVTPTPSTRVTQAVVEVLVRNPKPSFTAYIID